MPLAGLARDLCALVSEPASRLIDGLAIWRFEGEVMESDGVSIDRLIGWRLPLPEAERAVQIRAPEIVDRLATFTLLLDNADPSQWAEQTAIEGQASVE
jgi:hypothetical protein